MTTLGTIPIIPMFPSGTQAALNVTAAAVIKASPGCVMRVIVSAPGTTSGSLTINDSNANVTAQTITAITKAANGVVTVSTGGSTNPFTVGGAICFASVGGMTQLNSLAGTVVAIGGVTTAWTITISINTTSFTTYTSGGTCASFGAANQIFTAGFAALSTGQLITLECPCFNGILVSAVPGAGSPLYTIPYS